MQSGPYLILVSPERNNSCWRKWMLKRWSSTLAAHWNHPGNFKKHWCLSTTPRDSYLIGIGPDLVVRKFKSSPGDSKVQFKAKNQYFSGKILLLILFSGLHLLLSPLFLSLSPLALVKAACSRAQMGCADWSSWGVGVSSPGCALLLT